MKKSTLLNAEISYEIAKLGHTQTLTIGDAGLPVPAGVKRIDLAVAKGVPSFLQVLDAVLSEIKVEKITLAEEINAKAPVLAKHICKRLDANVETEYVPHERFKELTERSAAVIRTGETTPYANIILTSGVTF